MKTVGKVILAIVLAYAGFMLASFVGGVLAGLRRHVPVEHEDG